MLDFRGIPNVWPSMAKTGNSELREWFNFTVYFHDVQPFRHEGSVFSGKDFTSATPWWLSRYGGVPNLDTYSKATRNNSSHDLRIWVSKKHSCEWGLWGPYKWPKRKGNWGYFTRLLGIITPLIEAVGCRSCNNHHLKDLEKMVFNSVVPFRHLWDVKLVEVDVKSIWSFQNPTKILVFSVLCEMRRDASFKIWCHVIHVSKKHLHTQRWGPIEL